MVRSKTLMSRGIFFSSLVLRGDSASACWNYILAYFKRSDSNLENLKRHHVYLPAASTMARSHRSSLYSIGIVKRISSEYGRR